MLTRGGGVGVLALPLPLPPGSTYECRSAIHRDCVEMYRRKINQKRCVGLATGLVTGDRAKTAPGLHLMFCRNPIQHETCFEFSANTDT